MYNVPIKELVAGKEYVFGDYTESLGFIPVDCAPGPHHSRLTVFRVRRKYVDVRFCDGTVGRSFDGEGFFEIDVAKRLYREALKKRQSLGYKQTDEQIEFLVEGL